MSMPAPLKGRVVRKSKNLRGKKMLKKADMIDETDFFGDF